MAQRKDRMGKYNEWHIFSYTEGKAGAKVDIVIGEGTNSQGDGPNRIIGKISSEEDANAIIKAHNASLA